MFDLDDTKLTRAVASLRQFSGTELKCMVGELENSLKNCKSFDIIDLLAKYQINRDTLSAAAMVKILAGQIHVFIHAIGITACLPHILEEGEVVEYTSLGASSSKSDFDLVTDRRIAEFKFIRWRGADTVRQNALFKDLFKMAKENTTKRKIMYVLDTDRPMKFLKGNRSITNP